MPVHIKLCIFVCISVACSSRMPEASCLIEYSYISHYLSSGHVHWVLLAKCVVEKSCWTALMPARILDVSSKNSVPVIARLDVHHKIPELVTRHIPIMSQTVTLYCLKFLWTHDSEAVGDF